MKFTKSMKSLLSTLPLAAWFNLSLFLLTGAAICALAGEIAWAAALGLGAAGLAVAVRYDARRQQGPKPTKVDSPTPQIGLVGRNITAGVIATGADAAVAAALVAGDACSPAIATAWGCMVGAGVNYSINRVWTFKSQGAKTQEAVRYAIASLSSAGLNAGGVATLLLLPVMDYRIAWLIARVAVYAGWNFPLHRDYVFVSQQSAVDSRTNLAI